MQKTNRKTTVTVKRHDSEAQEQSRLIAWANEVSRLGVSRIGAAICLYRTAAGGTKRKLLT